MNWGFVIGGIITVPALLYCGAGAINAASPQQRGEAIIIPTLLLGFMWGIILVVNKHIGAI